MKTMKKHLKKALTLSLSVLMTIGEFPITVSEVHAAAAPSLQYFASKEDWKNLDLTDDNKSIKINLGTMPGAISGADTLFLPAGTVLTWWVVGSNGSTANLYSEKSMFTAQFSPDNGSETKQYSDSWGASYDKTITTVRINHYGGSPLRNDILKNLHSVLFKASENALVATSTIKCWDNLAQKTYTVSDKLFLPSAGSETSDCTAPIELGPVYLPENSGAFEHEIIPFDKWATPDGHTWLRTPRTDYNSYSYVRSTSRGQYIGTPWVASIFKVAPACGINLSSMLFSSAAPKASSAIGGQVLQTYSSSNFPIHNLRLKDNSNTASSIERKADYTKIKATKVPTSGTYYLMVQGVADNNANYVYSKKVEGGTTIIQTSEVTNVSSFENAKVWIEKESTNNDGQLLYATEPKTINGSLATFDDTAPEIKSVTLTHEKDGTETQYTAGELTKSNITATYSVQDLAETGVTPSGIDKENYQISLDGGTNYYNATSTVSGVEVLTRTESELKLKISCQGESDLRIKVADKSGNASESSSVNLKIDTIKPNSPTDVESATADIYSNNNKPTILGKGEVGCTVNIKEGANDLGSTTVAPDGSWQLSVNALSDGVHTLLVTQTDLAGNTSDSVSIVFKIDTQGPTGEISIRENKFTKFLNTITFGMFFKQDVEVTFKSSDENGSGLKKTEYLCLKLDETTQEFKTEADAIKAVGWTEVSTDEPFTMSGENLGKFIIYARITDNAGNITCINSDGVVIYKDSTTTVDNLTFTKTSKDGLPATIALNGNTIDKIINSTVNASEPLTLNEDYSIKDSTITFNNSYLKGLSAGLYTLDVYFNPAGEAFNPANESNSDTPNHISIKLTVQKGAQANKLEFEGIDSSNSYTYGDNPFQIITTGGSGDGAISYSIITIGNDDEVLDNSDNNQVATISNDGTVNILSAGTFRVTATKASDETYLDQSVTSSNIVVYPHSVTITGLTAKDKIYDGTNEAEFLGTPKISWIHKNDGENEVKVDSTTGQALFNDANVNLNTDTNAVQPKSVAFSRFSLVGTKASSYSLSQPPPTTAIIRQKFVTITGISAEDKDYDGKTDAKIIMNQDAKIDGKLESDDLNIDISNASANFENKNADKDKTVKFSGFTLSGSSKGNYNLESQPADITAEIRTKELHVSVSAENKKYDGLKTSKISASLDENEIISGDKLELAEYGDGEFETIGPGTGIKVVTFPIFSLKETETAKNYSLVQPDPNGENTVTANIEDGFSPEENTHYTLNTPDGSNFWYVHNDFIITAKDDYVISVDNKDSSDWKSMLSYSEQTDGTKVTFFVRNKETKEISVAKEVEYKKDSETPTGTININSNEFKDFLNTVTFGLFFKEKIDVTISGTDGENNISGISKIEYFKSENLYSKGSEIPQGSWIDGGAVNNNSISFSVGPESWNPNQLNEKFFVYARITDNAGNVCYLRSDGVVIYTDSAQNTKSIEFTKTSKDSVYASVNLKGNTIKTIFNGDKELSKDVDYVINESQIEFKAVYLDTLSDGDYTLIVHYNPAGENYTPSENSGSVEPNITDINLIVKKAFQAPITINGINSPYTYGDDPFEVYIEGGDGDGKVTFTSSDNSVADITGSTVKILKKGTFTITATKAANENYNGTTVQSSLITVNPKSVTLENIEVEDKTYDGDNEAGISKEPVLVGGVVGDDLSFVVGKAFFDNKDAGKDKTVTFTDFSLDGTKCENYVLLSQPTPVKANINKRAVNILGLSVENKIYDGLTDAKITGIYWFANLVGKENVDIKYGKADFSDKNIGDSKTVIFSEFDIAGSNSQNYFLESQPESVLANIEPKGIDIVNININSKIYDRTNKASFKSDPELSGIIAGDDISLISGTPSFKSSNVSENIPIEFTQFSIEGLDAQNYYLKAQPSAVTANIKPKELIIEDLKIKDKIYDGNDVAEFETTPTLDGVISPDEVILSVGTPSFRSSNVSENVPVEFTQFSIGGLDAQNYYLKAQPSAVTANIKPKELIIEDLKIKDKIYDGNDVAEFETTPTLDGVISPDEVILSTSTPIFSSKEVGNNISIIFTPEFSISGKDSHNYSLEPHPDITANINISTQPDNQNNMPVESEQQKSLSPEANQQHGVSTVFNCQDNDSGVWVEAPAGVFPENSKLIVQTLNYDPEEYEKVLTGLDEDKKQMAERLKLFEIHVIDSSGNIIQPNTDYGLVTVRIPIPDDFDKDDLEVYRVLFNLPDSEFDEYVVTIDNKHYCEFKTDHFSPYALVDKKSDDNFSKIIIVVSILILLIMIAILVFIFLKKNKDKNQNSNKLKSLDD